MSTKKQPHFNFKEPIYKLMYLYIGIIAILAVIGCCIGGFVSNVNSIAYASLIHIPFIILTIVINVIFNTLVTDYGASGMKKAAVTASSIFLFIAKYIILLLGLIIGVVVDVTTKVDYFNIYALVGCAFIYPIGSLIATIHYFIYERKKYKVKKKKVYNQASSYIVKENHEKN